MPCGTLEPVSYTHLDVYKRQPLTMPDPSKRACWKGSARTSKIRSASAWMRRSALRGAGVLMLRTYPLVPAAAPRAASLTGVIGSLVRRLYGSAPLLLCLAVLGWSGNFVVGRLVGGTVPPTQLAFLRWFGASLVIVPFAWRQVRADAAELRRRWVSVVVLSLIHI